MSKLTPPNLPSSAIRQQAYPLKSKPFHFCGSKKWLFVFSAPSTVHLISLWIFPLIYFEFLHGLLLNAPKKFPHRPRN